MKITIEEYRGWNISFDTEKETFYTVSDSYDREETKKSFASIKKFIDDFIKENSTFTPVWVEIIPGTFSTHKKVKLIGIRKDGKFFYETAEGEKGQISLYNEKDYIIYNPENDIIYNKIADCNERTKEIRKEQKELEEKIIRVGLSEIKRKYII